MTDPPELRGRHHMKRQATAVRRQAAVASLSQPRRSSYPVPPPTCALHTSLLPRHIPLRLGLSHSKNVRISNNTRKDLRYLRRLFRIEDVGFCSSRQSSSPRYHRLHRPRYPTTQTPTPPIPNPPRTSSVLCPNTQCSYTRHMANIIQRRELR